MTYWRYPGNEDLWNDWAYYTHTDAVKAGVGMNVYTYIQNAFAIVYDQTLVNHQTYEVEHERFMEALYKKPRNPRARDV